MTRVLNDIVTCSVCTESITLLRDLLESGDVVPQIDSQWTLAEAIEAARHLETGHAAGKVVITCLED